MAAKKTSAGRKAGYERYKTEGRRLKNKRSKIARHLNRNPNDAQNRAALENVGKGPQATTRR